MVALKVLHFFFLFLLMRWNPGPLLRYTSPVLYFTKLPRLGSDICSFCLSCPECWDLGLQAHTTTTVTISLTLSLVWPSLLALAFLRLFSQVALKLTPSFLLGFLHSCCSNIKNKMQLNDLSYLQWQSLHLTVHILCSSYLFFSTVPDTVLYFFFPSKSFTNTHILKCLLLNSQPQNCV